MKSSDTPTATGSISMSVSVLGGSTSYDEESCAEIAM